jgi:RNA polymerase sigma-70 factor (ECF subfamily)
MAAYEPDLSSHARAGAPQAEPDVKESSSLRFSAVEWRALVSQIQTGDEAGMEQLYKLFSRGIRYYLYRQLGPQELEDKVHDTFLIVVGAIQRGDLREPERLMGFV